MPNIAPLHPQVVHFVVASLFIGLPLYWLAFIPRARFLGSAATILLVIGTLSTWVAVESGEQAHEPVEDIPGALTAVEEHEEWGERTRILFTVVMLAHLVGLGLGRVADQRALLADETVENPVQGLRTAVKSLALLTALGWTGGLAVLFETAEHGGDIVYKHAGGVGTRSGDPEDVQRLLIAGLYQEAILDRNAGQYEDAARLVDEMARRLPDDPEVRLLMAESQIEDRRDGRAALRVLVSLQPQDPAGRTSRRKALLTSDAYALLQIRDSARIVLDALPEALQTNPGVVQRSTVLRSP